MKTRRELLDEFVERLRFAAGPDLESVVLYGSAAKNGFHETYSDVNLLCTLKKLTRERMAKLAGPVQWWSVEHNEHPPLFFTTEELQSSSDVFAIELLDIKTSHKVLFGEDVVRDIDVPLNLHRIELEHELRTLLLKLRNHYFLAHGDEARLRAVLAKSVSGALTLLRHAVFAVDGKMPPPSNHEALGRAAQLFGFEPVAIENVVRLRESEDEERSTGDLVSIYETYVLAIIGAINSVDRLAPTEQWQRVR
jgi:hypothetical protein